MTHRIDKIIIGCYRGDLWWTRMCVASVRYWCPKQPLFLLKDEGQGDFATREIETAWNVGVLDLGKAVRYSSPVAKTEVFYLAGQRVLFIDSDIIFVGPLLELLERHSEDFLVSPSRIAEPEHEHVKEHYYDWRRLRELDPTFSYPGYVFNSGQFVATGGIVQRAEVERFFEPPGSGRLSFPDMFAATHDQGVLNYVLPRIVQAGRATLALVDFKLFAHATVITEAQVPMAAQVNKTAAPALIHYAGEKFPLNSQYLRPDLLDFYERLYYSAVPHGVLLRRLRAAGRAVRWFPAYWLRQFRSHVPKPLRKLVRTLVARR